MSYAQSKTFNVPSTEEVASAFNAGNAAWRKAQWAEALEAYSAATTLQPTLTDAHLGRARSLAKLGQWMPAREAFAAVLRLDSKHYSAWLEAGHLCRQMGELRQAASAYERAIGFQPERDEAYLGLARVQLLQRHGSAARSTYAHAVAVKPERRLKFGELMGQYALEAGDAHTAVHVLQASVAYAGSDDER